MARLLKQSTAATVKMGPFVDTADGFTAKTALTIAQADIRLAKEGGAFAQTHNAAGATHDEHGYYGVPLDTTDTGTLGRLRVAVSVSGALPVWEDFMVLPANVYDSLVSGSADLAVNAAQIGGQAASLDANNLLKVDVEDWKGAAAAAMTGDAYARLGAPAGASVSADVAAIKSETDTILTDVNTGAGAIYNRIGAPAGASIAADIAAVKTDVDATETRVTTALPNAAPGGLNGLPTVDASNHIAGIQGTKTTLDALNDLSATQVEDAVWDADLGTHHTTPASAGADLHAAGSATDPWSTNLPGAYSAGEAGYIVGNNLNAKVGDVKAKTDNLPADPASESLVEAATTAIYDRIGAPAGASVSADIAEANADTDELITTIGAAGAGLTSVSLAATGLDSIAMSDISAVPGITATLKQALNWIFCLHRNKRDQNGSVETVYKDDSTTAIGTSAKSDNGTTFSRGKYS